jgi:membrane protein YdbS with pleckstrin-like domain
MTEAEQTQTPQTQTPQPQTTQAQTAPLTGIQWRRVSPKYVWVDLLSTLIGMVITVGALSAPALLTRLPWLWLFPAAVAVVFIVTLALTPRRVRAIGFVLREDDLVFRRGILFQRTVAVPYGRMQLVDINRGPFDRAFGLSELKFVTAAAATGVTIPGLPAEEAEELRDALAALAESRRAGL